MSSIRTNFIEKFSDDNEYSFQEECAREFLEGDLGMLIILYQIDKDNSNPDAIYNEVTSDNISYKEPVELYVSYKISEGEIKSYLPSTTTAQFRSIGELTFPIFESQLIENNCDINIGDIIAIPIKINEYELFEISDDGRANIDNKHSILGFRKMYRNVTGVMIDPNRFKSLEF
jgi:hypothetical protein